MGALCVGVIVKYVCNVLCSFFCCCSPLYFAASLVLLALFPRSSDFVCAFRVADLPTYLFFIDLSRRPIHLITLPISSFPFFNSRLHFPVSFTFHVPLSFTLALPSFHFPVSVFSISKLCPYAFIFNWPVFFLRSYFPFPLFCFF